MTTGQYHIMVVIVRVFGHIVEVLFQAFSSSVFLLYCSMRQYVCRMIYYC